MVTFDTHFFILLSKLFNTAVNPVDEYFFAFSSLQIDCARVQTYFLVVTELFDNPFNMSVVTCNIITPSSPFPHLI